MIAISETRKGGNVSSVTDDNPLGYRVCSDVLLRLWMYKVLTDGEYNRIMDRLNCLYEEGRIK